MEFKHFSHTHALVAHQMLQRIETHCSGCNSPCSSSFYACWPCNFFLDEQCFKATRSIIHPSHPSHPLTLLSFPTYPSNSFFCNSCSMLGSGFSYSCAHCEFDLHIQCSKLAIPTNPYPNQTIPNQTPSLGAQSACKPQNTALHASIQNVSKPYLNVLTSSPSTGAPEKDNPPTLSLSKDKPVQLLGKKHFSHNHLLYLSKVQEKDVKACSGCEGNLVGWAYKCKESSCNFYLHQSCFKLPRELRHKSHLDHPLTLLPKSSYESGEFTCSACDQNGSAFNYNCSTCEFDLHVDCASLPETVIWEEHEHPLDLLYSSPLQKVEGGDQEFKQPTFTCDMCQQPVPEMCWMYYCEKCDFGGHLECTNSQENPVEKSKEDVIREAQVQLERLQLLMNLRGQNGEFILDLI